MIEIGLGRHVKVPVSMEVREIEIKGHMDHIEEYPARVELKRTDFIIGKSHCYYNSHAIKFPVSDFGMVDTLIIFKEGNQFIVADLTAPKPVVFDDTGVYFLAGDIQIPIDEFRELFGSSSGNLTVDPFAAEVNK